MGGCSSKLTQAEIEARKKNRKFIDQNQQQYKKESEKIKILLLGAGESGKSTVFKQMRILYGEGYSVEERSRMRQIIYGNVILGAQALINGAKDNKINITCTEEAQKISALSDENILLPEHTKIFKKFWSDPGTLEAFEQRSKFQLHESVEKYFQKIEEICQGPDRYIPTVDDVLLCRVRTSGVIVERYTIDDVPFEMYDVGGQKNERKKWIHCFDDVTTVIFVAAISDYDLTMYEDNTKPRMEDALKLFEEITNNPSFKNTSMILFLNKRDLFERKLKTVDLGLFFPQFTMGLCRCDGGYPNTFKCTCMVQNVAKTFMTDLFIQVKPTNKKLFTHITCATDTENVQTVFNACKEIILTNNLHHSGLASDDDN